MFMLTIPPFSFHALDLRCRRCWFPLAVLAANLLCRLPDPTLFLGRMHSFIKRDGVSTWRAALGLQTCLAGCLPVECCCPGSCTCPSLQVLVLVSPYSWLPGWTPRDKWLGGFLDQASSSCIEPLSVRLLPLMPPVLSGIWECVRGW
jgi:hypothetical protein